MSSYRTWAAAQPPTRQASRKRWVILIVLRFGRGGGRAQILVRQEGQQVLQFLRRKTLCVIAWHQRALGNHQLPDVLHRDQPQSSAFIHHLKRVVAAITG